LSKELGRVKTAYPVPYNAYRIHGISMEFTEIPWILHGFHGIFMDSIEIYMKFL
jgi:hypothetical protein